MPKKPNKTDRAKRIPHFTGFGERARERTLRHMTSGGTITGLSLNTSGWIRNDKAATENGGMPDKRNDQPKCSPKERDAETKNTALHLCPETGEIL
jgi:hypothetical protein